MIQVCLFVIYLLIFYYVFYNLTYQEILLIVKTNTKIIPLNVVIYYFSI